MQNKTFIIFIVSILLAFPPMIGKNNPHKKPKIVALLPVKNEALVIEQCLRGLALYTDAIILLDDASEDNTLEIVESLAQECKIEKIIKNEKWHRNETSDRGKLFKAGREIGGTHFIILDADEMFTADCLKNDFLRKKILALKPGDTITLPWIPLWRDIYTYRTDKGITLRGFICCDDGTCCYQTKKFIHTSRFPKNLKKGKDTIISTHGVLHFQAVNIKNMGIRKAWYMCLEKIRCPHMSLEARNKKYDPMTNEEGLKLVACPKQWYEGYDFFDGSAFKKIDTYRRSQIYRWFDEHGFEKFSDLDLSCLSDSFGE